METSRPPLSDPSQLAPGVRTHVLQVVGSAIVGGMQSRVERLVEQLPREQFAFTALCPFESPVTDRLRTLEAEVHIAPMPDDPPRAPIRMATAMLAAGGIDLLHAHLPKAHPLAALVGKFSTRPVLAIVHGRQLTTLDLEIHRATGSHLGVVCRQSFFQAVGMGVSSGLLGCDTNGVDTRVFKPQSGRSVGLREQLGLAHGCGDGGEVPLIGFVGLQAPSARRQRPSRGRVAAPPGPPAWPDRTTSDRPTTEREWFRQRHWPQRKQREQRELHAQRGQLTSHAPATQWCGALSAAPRAFERWT